MAKRFTENMKWEDSWFRKLRPVAKLFWLFIVDKCDIAGFWETDWELASFYIGENIDESILQDFQGRLERINNNGKIWVVKFCEFQYGCLNPAVGLHRAVISLLEKRGVGDRIKELIVESEGLGKGSGRVKEGLGKGSGRVKEGLGKGSGRVKEKEKTIYNIIKEENHKGEGNGELTEDEVGVEFERLWEKYPNKDGKKEARGHFLAQVKTKKDIEAINKAMNNYLGSKNVQDGFIKAGKTFFNNWQDWIDFKGVGSGAGQMGFIPKFDEDKEFICYDCKQVFLKIERKYGEDGKERCDRCYKKYIENWKEEHKKEMEEFKSRWIEMSEEQKIKQIDLRKKFGLEIPDWMEGK